MRPPDIAAEFTRRFGRACEAAARAPGRVNLIGEHTDYNEGYVLPMALEQCTWAAVAQRADPVARVIAADLNEEQNWGLDTWNPEQFPHWSSYIAGVETLLRRRGARLRGFDLLIQSQVPVGSGLSSSAALEVSTALALSNLAGEALESREFADLCREAEHAFAGVPCGIMDQYVSLLAKADTAFLLDCRARTYQHIPLSLDGHAILIVDSGVRHELAAGEYAKRLAQCQAAVTYFQKRDPSVRALRDVTVETVRTHALQMEPLAAARALHVTSEIRRTLAAAEALRRGDLAAVGRLMRESHRSLRDDYEVSSPELDRLVEIVGGVEGVLGARMTGAGFGGCIVALAREESLPRIAAALESKYDSAGAAKSRLIQSRPGAGAAIAWG